MVGLRHWAQQRFVSYGGRPMFFDPIPPCSWKQFQWQCVDHEIGRPICIPPCKQFFLNGNALRLIDQKASLAFAVPASSHFLMADVCTYYASTVWPSGLRRWLQAPVRKGVGSNPTAVTLFFIA